MAGAAVTALANYNKRFYKLYIVGFSNGIMQVFTRNGTLKYTVESGGVDAIVALSQTRPRMVTFATPHRIGFFRLSQMHYVENQCTFDKVGCPTRVVCGRVAYRQRTGVVRRVDNVVGPPERRWRWTLPVRGNLCWSRARVRPREEPERDEVVRHHSHAHHRPQGGADGAAAAVGATRAGLPHSLRLQCKSSSSAVLSHRHRDFILSDLPQSSTRVRQRPRLYFQHQLQAASAASCVPVLDALQDAYGHTFVAALQQGADAGRSRLAVLQVNIRTDPPNSSIQFMRAPM